jgi:hypothetical protein
LLHTIHNIIQHTTVLLNYIPTTEHTYQTPLHAVTVAMPPHALHFVKRDNMGFLFPPTVIVIFVLLGAGFLIACGYAIHSAFGFGSDNNNMKSMGAEQASYLAEVRIRNMVALEHEGRMAWGRGNKNQHGRESASTSGLRQGETVYD